MLWEGKNPHEKVKRLAMYRKITIKYWFFLAIICLVTCASCWLLWSEVPLESAIKPLNKLSRSSTSVDPHNS
ncbi:heparin sulfate O-sulfotransferase-like [Glossina fuscipes]|uniref:Heparin sulfate O-sulfotransferase-like n=1 Tax=Glossina fuscipes TaxID=7396 RepID=A0A9C5ZDP9_9MUSC|nr:heparin sulfate O-sulfotransferase-like [Glossina fuscipes]